MTSMEVFILHHVSFQENFSSSIVFHILTFKMLFEKH